MALRRLRCRRIRSQLDNGEVASALSVVEADAVGATAAETLARAARSSRPILNCRHGAWRRTATAACDFVTLSGDLLSRHGVYTGGYLNGNGNGKAPSSILGRKNQIAELQIALAQLQEQVAEAQPPQRRVAERANGIAGRACSRRRRNCASRKWRSPRAQGEFNALQNSQPVAAPEN